MKTHLTAIELTRCVVLGALRFFDVSKSWSGGQRQDSLVFKSETTYRRHQDDLCTL
jgi:hypothetical protein